MDNNKNKGTKRRFAGWMQRRFEQLPRNGKVTVMLLGLLLAGSYCGLLILGGISGKAKSVVSISPIRVLEHIGSTAKIATPVISSDEYEKIHRFRRYMDSLARSPSGRVYFDSIIQARPGLLDSITIVEQLYYSQKNRIDKKP